MIAFVVLPQKSGSCWAVAPETAILYTQNAERFLGACVTRTISFVLMLDWRTHVVKIALLFLAGRKAELLTSLYRS